MLSRQSSDYETHNIDFASDRLVYGTRDGRLSGNTPRHRARNAPQRKSYSKKRRNSTGISGTHRRRIRTVMW